MAAVLVEVVVMVLLILETEECLDGGCGPGMGA